jgi:flavin reductase (DIM6/NTAB) family NADH-FMN oxidoreductase RutF
MSNRRRLHLKSGEVKKYSTQLNPRSKALNPRHVCRSPSNRLEHTSRGASDTEFMSSIFFEPAQLKTAKGLKELGLLHNPMTALVVPRPIGWISTRSTAGTPNLAPFSFSNMVSQNPSMFMFCANAQHEDGGDKDSLKNARETGEFVFNLATYELRDQMNMSSATVARHVNEFELAGLTEAPCRHVRAPRVLEAPVSLECKVVMIIDLPRSGEGGLPNTMTIGEVVGAHIRRDIIRNGIVDTLSVRPLARLGYLDYGVCGDVFSMGRPEGLLTHRGAR